MKLDKIVSILWILLGIGGLLKVYLQELNEINIIFICLNLIVAGFILFLSNKEVLK